MQKNALKYTELSLFDYSREVIVNLAHISHANEIRLVKDSLYAVHGSILVCVIIPITNIKNSLFIRNVSKQYGMNKVDI